jgi:hypothetical protein
MADLFDMVSGTSTGSLLATAIVLPNPNYNSTSNSSEVSRNLFWAEDAIKIYTERGSEVFSYYELPLGYQILGAFVFSLIGGALGLCTGVSCYHN